MFKQIIRLHSTTVVSRCNVTQGTGAKLRYFENHVKSWMSTLSHCAILIVVFLHTYAFVTFPDPTEGIIGLLNLPFKYTVHKKTSRPRFVKYGNSPRFFKKVITFYYFYIFTIIFLQFKQYQSTENLAIYRYRYEIKTNKIETGFVVIFSRPLKIKEKKGEYR